MEPVKSFFIAKEKVMIFDKELMFVEDDGTAMHNLETGVLGRVVDLGAKNQGRGREAFVAIVFKTDTTATGNPNISFALETSGTEDFTTSATIPLNVPTPLSKTEMAEGMHIVSQMPVMGLDRYVRLKLTTDSPIACTGMEAGFVLDVPQR